MSKITQASAADIDIMARTLFGEARGEGVLGMIAVAHVILSRCHRRRWYGENVPDHADHSIGAVCRKPWQFSCWNSADPNLPLLREVDLSNRHFRRAWMVACGAINNEAGFGDPVVGSDHYYAAGTPVPKWALGRRHVCSVGRHLFFNDIP